MRQKPTKLLGFLIIFLYVFYPLTGQFGKNKINYENFDWKYLKSEHFDIYHYQGGENLARFSAPIAENQISRLSKTIGWNMDKRVPLLVYNSHNDFQQTNVVRSYLPEGVEGVTEMLKNRAVVAFDGGKHDYWHVLRHELFHVYLNEYIYGGSIQSVISGRVQTRVPLWMEEGMAEYASINWNARTDMIMRDLVISSRIPELNQLSGYLAYKGGQSFYKFLEAKYGVEKIGELWRTLKAQHKPDKTFKKVFGKELKKVSEDWQQWLKKRYWPGLDNRQHLDDFATQLTHHQKLKNTYNTAPSISPNGKRIALITDRKGYMDIYLISALDGEVIKKVLRGGNKPALEELKILKPQIDWSPNGEKLVIATKSGKYDALIFIDIKKEEYNRIPMENVEEIYSAAWSPEGDRVVFSGVKGGRSDLYTYNIDSDTVTRLTNDKYSDFSPNWSPEGDKIVFASARNYRTKEGILPGKRIDHHADLFVYDLNNGQIKQIYKSSWNCKNPVWGDNNNIYFSSDSNGVSNLYAYDMEKKQAKAITNALTGCYFPDISGGEQKLAFAGYSNRGWDIYTINNPMQKTQEVEEIALTEYAKEKKRNKLGRGEDKIDKLTTQTKIKAVSSAIAAGYRDHVFRRGSYVEESNQEDTDKNVSQQIDEDTSQTSSDTLKEGEYKIKNYKTKFTLDYVNSRASYSTYWGTQGTNVFVFSDILGNHRITMGTEMYLDLKNSDYYFTYDYLKQRIDYSLSAFHQANFYMGRYGYLRRWRIYGLDLASSYPFSKFSRLEGGLRWYNVNNTLIDRRSGQTYNLNKLNTIMPRAAFVLDNSIWRYIHPIDGWRIRMDGIVSPKYNDNALEFVKLNADIRKYIKLGGRYSIALRAASGISLGKNEQKYFVGGMRSWLNRDFKRQPNLGSAEELYFSNLVTPLRGARYYERVGSKYFLTNFEFRYPFIEYLKLGWPLPMLMGGIEGCTFIDMGTAWNDDLDLFGHDEFSGLYTKDLVSGVGFGARMYLGYFILRFDTAWRYDFDSFSKPKYYISLGLDY